LAASASQGASQTQHAALDQAVTRAAPAAHQVAREIVRQFNGDSTRFELRLDPPELGRVEVRLDVSRDHRVTAVIAADSPQALTELARHARELEQMLQSAGLELADNGLSFDLRQGNEGANTNDGAGAPFGEATIDAVVEEAAPQARPLGFERWRGVRVDMMV
jgi:flagellar hook-length control protein FliK